jgi:hypothetical protein
MLHKLLLNTNTFGPISKASKLTILEMFDPEETGIRILRNDGIYLQVDTRNIV